MTYRKSSTCLIIVSSLFCLASGLARGTGAELDRDVTEMLDSAWKPSPTGLKVAEQQYEKLREQNAGDVRVRFAYALVLLKNRRYEDATKLLGEILATHKNYVPARRAKAWAEALTKNCPAAIADMEVLVQTLPEDTNSRHEAEWIDLAAFLGRMIGFLEGPAQMPAHTTQAYKDKAAARLAGTRLAAYAKAQHEVADKFASYGLTQQQTKAADKVAGEEKKEQLKQEVAAEKIKIEADKTNLQAEAAKLMSEQQRELAALEAKARPLQQALQVSQGQIAQWSNVFANAQNDLANAQNAANRSKTSGDRGDRTSQLQTTLNNAEANLHRARTEAAVLSNQLAVLEQARVATLAKYGAQGNRLEKRAGDLTKGEKRVGITEKSLTKTTPASTPQSRALAIAAVALTTYDEFPFDHVRQKLLESLRVGK